MARFNHWQWQWQCPEKKNVDKKKFGKATEENNAEY